MESIYYVMAWACHRKCRHCYEDRFRPYVRDGLEAVVRELLAERGAAAAAAAAGPGFARAVHDGRRSTAVLAPWLLAP